MAAKLYVVAKWDDSSGITKDHEYEVLAFFTTSHCISGYCIVILNDRLVISGYDIQHFKPFEFI